MTRINIVPPKELMDQHLMAEYREILLLTAMLKRTLESKSGFQARKVPDRYTLNSGHVYFFFNKGRYIYQRFNQVKNELLRRGYNVTQTFPVEQWPAELYNDWEPRLEDFEIIRERIAAKIALKPWWYRHSGA